MSVAFQTFKTCKGFFPVDHYDRFFSQLHSDRNRPDDNQPASVTHNRNFRHAMAKLRPENLMVASELRQCPRGGFSDFRKRSFRADGYFQVLQPLPYQMSQAHLIAGTFRFG